jgi:hypothetical protein
MKNIHVLPTDKPSRLLKQDNGKYVLSKTNVFSHISKHLSNINQNIYITSDEIVTEYSQGLYFIDVYTGNSHIFSPIYINKETIAAGKFHTYMNNGNMCKKIIMTTDPQLIANGVQAIDDEFLEWFVKNPSCEFVEVEEILYRSNSKDKYEIIIPKEEPKIISDWLDQNRNPEIDKQVEKEAEQLSKQETLEETAFVAGEESFKEFRKGILEANRFDFVCGFTAGAKWQQEQYTIEEQHVGHTIDELDKEYIKGFNEGSAYYIERMYSEEEVIDLIQSLSMNEDFNGYGSVSKETAKYFLEQFKKK